MSWRLSRFRAGDLVEVRSKDEILATLDARGCSEGMPFMPEMLRFCGQRFRVSAVAHKTCETAHRTWKGRAIETAVHLAGLRCDGTSHGGCQADCNLFWKDAWLKSVERSKDHPQELRSSSPRSSSCSRGCAECDLTKSVRLPGTGDGAEPLYFCQATALYDATKPLPWWNVRQYVRDVTTGNHPPSRVVRVLWLAFLKHLWRRSPVGYRVLRRFRGWMHLKLTGREVPDFAGTITGSSHTPAGRLDLKPGDRVRIKTKEEIARTLDELGRNRGLYFDVEMAPYCGQVAVVRRSVTRIIDESTGEMRHMKQPCIALEGVACGAAYSECRLLCPRGIRSYWREIWLEKVPAAQPSASERPASQTELEKEYAATR